MGDILWWTRMGPGFVTLSLSSLAAPGPGLYRTRSASPPRPPPTAVARAPRSLRSRSKTWSGVIFMNKEIPHPQVRLHRSVYNTPWARIQGLEQEGAQPCRRKCVASAAACPAALAAGGGKSGGGSRAVRLAGHGTSSFGAQTCGTCAELPTLPIQTLSPRSGGRSRGELRCADRSRPWTLDAGFRVPRGGGVAVVLDGQPEELPNHWRGPGQRAAGFERCHLRGDEALLLVRERRDLAGVGWIRASAGVQNRQKGASGSLPGSFW